MDPSNQIAKTTKAMKRIKLTIEEHREIGKELKRITRGEGVLSIRIPNGCGISSRVGRSYMRARRSLDVLKSELENVCATECRGFDHTGIYYGEEIQK